MQDILNEERVVTDSTRLALENYTQRHIRQWQQEREQPPASELLYDIPSPCALYTDEEVVFWQPQPFYPRDDLSAVERALSIKIQPSVVAFYTTQFAGDMPARFEELNLSLIQVWNREDFIRLQENLIGHLVMKRSLKQSPTFFIATTESEQSMISVNNLNGEVILEQTGTTKNKTLAKNLEQFLNLLSPNSELFNKPSLTL